MFGSSLDLSEIDESELATVQARIIKAFAEGFRTRQVTYRLFTANYAEYQVEISTNQSFSLSEPTSPDDEPLSIPITLRSVASFTIDPNDCTIAGNNFKDFETLYGLLRRETLATCESYEDESVMSYRLTEAQDPTILACSLKALGLHRILTTYKRRLEQCLFQNFAISHPGMEPLGGVSKGGTFVLVYTHGSLSEAHTPIEDPTTSTPREREADKPREVPYVVGDFCLPYRCSETIVRDVTHRITHVLDR